MNESVLRIPSCVLKSDVEVWLSLAVDSADGWIWFANAADTLAGILPQQFTRYPSASSGHDPDVIIVFSPNDVARRESFRTSLPPVISLLAASCADDLAIGMSVNGLCRAVSSECGFSSFGGLVIEIASTGKIGFVEGDARVD